MARRFKVGDEVQLVKPFRCHGDDEKFDQKLDKRVREDYGNRGVISSDSYVAQGYLGYGVKWGIKPSAFLYVDDEVIGLIVAPVTPEEEAAFLKEAFGI